MAVSSSRCALLLFAVLISFAVAAAGRPCKALIISYTFPIDSADPSSQRQISDDPEHPRSRSVTIYRVIPIQHYFSRSRILPAAGADLFATAIRLPDGIDRPRFDFDSPLAVSSLRERTRDVLVVVAALVFGIGCGALTSAMIYLAWYMINNRSEVCGLHDYDSDDDVEDGLESPKKRGYADLPAAPATPVSPLKE